MIFRLATAALLLAASAGAQPAEVRIGVFGLFEPTQLELRAAGSGPLRVSNGLPVEGERPVRIVAAGDLLLVTVDGKTSETSALSTASGATFTISVPGKLSRDYRGALKITASDGKLTPVVTMALQDAVAAAVAAEADVGGPEQALIAQAVASRSYLASDPRHDGAFEFCDTTHCQYLTDAFEPRAVRAAEASRGFFLWAGGRVHQALFTRSCSNTWCSLCQADPVRWTREHALGDVLSLLEDRTEAARIAVVRRLGWSAIPSNAFDFESHGERVVLRGTGEGHGLGLCQRGAVGMARHGATWRDILSRYFPEAVIR